jgi:hypothetical protein
MSTFWYVTPCSLTGFGATYCLQLNHLSLSHWHLVVLNRTITIIFCCERQYWPFPLGHSVYPASCISCCLQDNTDGNMRSRTAGGPARVASSPKPRLRRWRWPSSSYSVRLGLSVVILYCLIVRPGRGIQIYHVTINFGRERHNIEPYWLSDGSALWRHGFRPSLHPLYSPPVLDILPSDCLTITWPS